MKLRIVTYLAGVSSALAAIPDPTQEPTGRPTGTPTHQPTAVIECSQASCTRLGWDPLRYGSVSTCGGPGLESCGGVADWETAREICQLEGARLCTVAEVLADEVRDTGCGYNEQLIWTSTACTGGYKAAYGATTNHKAPKDYTQCVPRLDATVAVVRCCADTIGCGPTALPTHEPTPHPTPQPSSKPIFQPTPRPTPRPIPKPTQQPTQDKLVDACSRKSCDALGNKHQPGWS